MCYATEPLFSLQTWAGQGAAICRLALSTNEEQREKAGSWRNQHCYHAWRYGHRLPDTERQSWRLCFRVLQTLIWKKRRKEKKEKRKKKARNLMKNCRKCFRSFVVVVVCLLLLIPFLLHRLGSEGMRFFLVVVVIFVVVVVVVCSP